MRKTPSKIWLDEDWSAWQHADQGEGKAIAYIREDLVDELYEALEECVKQNVGCSARDMAEAALAKIKEEQ